MNEFINSLYQDGQGKDVTGFYFAQPFMGKIASVRLTYGGGGNVYVDLESPVYLHGAGGTQRDSLVLDGEEIFNGEGDLTRNLHVYL